jgi:large subunit ribosomal protein L18
VKDKTYKPKFRRRREGKTNYTKRLALIRAKKVKITVRKTNKQIIAQAIKYNPKGDETIASATSKELDSFGFYGTNNTPSAYLTGYLLGKRMTKKEAVLDIGMQSPSHGSVIFACLKGVIDAGINIPHNAKAIPSEERLTGKVLEEYAKINTDKFSNYEKKGVKVDGITSAFKKAKEEIEKTSTKKEVKK